MPYHWWPATLAALVGIEPHEVQQVLAADRRLPRAAVALGLPVITVWARTGAGRPLIVVLRDDDGRDWTIIGATPMLPAQLAEFEAWEAQR